MVKNGEINSSSTEFFFVTNKIQELDGRYAVFGQIIKGLEVLEKIDNKDFIYEGKKEKPGDKISKLSKIMADARMPMFCPSCEKVMKKRLDDKMWSLYGHCFDCQVKFENKLRVKGEYEEWEKQKVINNKIGYIKDQIQAIKEWKDMKAPEWYNNVGVNYPELEKEKWDVNIEKFQKEADEALGKYTEVLEQLESEQ